jgi:hypothetical protein
VINGLRPMRRVCIAGPMTTVRQNGGKPSDV